MSENESEQVMLEKREEWEKRLNLEYYLKGKFKVLEPYVKQLKRELRLNINNFQIFLEEIKINILFTYP